MSSNATESKKILDALAPPFHKLVDRWTSHCLRSKKMQVVTAYDPDTGLIGVKEAFGPTIYIPCSIKARYVPVGNCVRVLWYGNDASTMVAEYTGTGYSKAEYFELGKRSLISTGEDLNAYLAPGNYGCSSNATAATLSNCPVTSAFILNVMDSVGKGSAMDEAYSYRIQMLTTYGGKEVWVRQVYTNSSATLVYGTWNLLASQEVASSDTLTSSFSVAAGTSCSGTSHSAYKRGKICFLRIRLTSSESIANGSSVTADVTFPSGCTPAVDTNSSTYYVGRAIIGSLATDGHVIYRNTGSTNVPSDTNLTMTFSYPCV